MKNLRHRFDFCVVGAGIAGLCAAIAAARQGIKVALVNDRPMFGGHSSSETRMHVSGAERHNTLKNKRETGIVEEFRLENLRRNPQKSYSVWDTVLYDKVRQEPNISYFLNCSVLKAEMDGSRITSVTGWQWPSSLGRCRTSAGCRSLPSLPLRCPAIGKPPWRRDSTTI